MLSILALEHENENRLQARGELFCIYIERRVSRSSKQPRYHGSKIVSELHFGAGEHMPVVETGDPVILETIPCQVGQEEKTGDRAEEFDPFRSARRLVVRTEERVGEILQNLGKV